MNYVGARKITSHWAAKSSAVSGQWGSRGGMFVLFLFYRTVVSFLLLALLVYFIEAVFRLSDAAHVLVTLFHRPSRKTYGFGS